MKTRRRPSVVARRVGRVLLLICCSAEFALSAIGVWKTYTSKKEVRDVALRNGIAWVAASGGMFFMSIRDSNIQEFTTSEGLRSNDLTSIAVDPAGNVWTGTAGGFLQSYSPSTGQWKYIADIFRESAPQKKIIALAVFGDTLFIASEIGVSEYLIARDEFRFTARRFGVSPQLVGNITTVAVYLDSIWIGSANGIASAFRADANLSAPGSWHVRTTGGASFLSVFRDALYAGTQQGLARFDGSSWTTVPGTSGMNVLRLAPQNDLLYFVSADTVLTLDTLGNVSRLSSSSFSSPLTSLAVEGNEVVLGSGRNGIYVQRSGSWQSVVSKGPPTNRIVGIAVDQNGVLWAGTGTSGGEGFMSFDGREWSSYTAQAYPALGGNNYYKVSIGKDNVKWASSWGGGVALVDDKNLVRRVLNTTNGLLPTVLGDPNFVVVGGIATDGRGRAWITNRTPPCDTALIVFEPDSSISYLTNKCLRFPPSPTTIFTDVVIDNNGTKWFANFNRFEPVPPQGLFFYNERLNLPGTSAGWGQLTTNDVLTSSFVWSLAVDAQGELWIGSDEGITIIFDTADPRNRAALYHPLSDQTVQAIAVDPLNNKWAATKQGVFVLSPDGTTIITQYTVENTEGKLVDDDISSLVIDAKTGTVYFGSDKGLSTLTTTAVAPVGSFGELTITPNPFYLPAASSITVDGLVLNSSLKILSIDGKLVKDLKTPGGRIGFWDGTDFQGNLVSSGVYIIVAFSENGGQVAAGKVAVVRR